jgi:protein O-mannosyl-transferase
MLNPRLLGAIAVAIVLYVRTLGFDYTYLDDDVLVRDDQAFLARPTSPLEAFSRSYFHEPRRTHAYYRPVVTASYAIDANLGGRRPGIYHATNLALHALVVGLLFQLLRRFGYGANLAFFGALLFAVHPALTQTVAWIPGRNDALLAVFSLLAWLLLLGAHEPDRRIRRIGHVACFLGALLCKETAVVLPVLWAVQGVYLDKRPWRQVLAPWVVAGWALALVVYVAARTLVLGNMAGLHGMSVQAALGNLALLPASLGKLVMPVHLSVLAIPEDTPWWAGVVGTGLVTTLFLWRKVRRSAAWFGPFAFAVLLLPSLPVATLLVLENRLYLPALGVVLLVCETARAMEWRGRLPGSLAGAGVVGLATAAFLYGGNFSDRITFCEAAVRGSPHSSLAHRNLGVAYHVRGDERRAWAAYQQALAQDRSEPVANNNMAVILMGQGRLPEAVELLHRELLIDPDYVPAERNLAISLRGMNRPDEAAQHWQRVLSLGSIDREAMRELAGYYQTRDPGKAEHLQRMLQSSQ